SPACWARCSSRSSSAPSPSSAASRPSSSGSSARRSERAAGLMVGRASALAHPRVMSDLAVLGLVVVALYLGECAWWVRHGAAILAAPFFFGRGSLRVLSRALGNARGAFALLNPLPPFGRAYVVEP